MIQQFVIKFLTTLSIVLLYVSSAMTLELENRTRYSSARSTLIPRPTDYISHERVLADQNVATGHIVGVLNMYRQNVQLGRQDFYLDTNSIRGDVNASYNPSTRTFALPYVLTRNCTLYPTCTDQGIVSHESGHMVLSLIMPALGNTSHTGALHEAFGDLTAHFYRFHNHHTRQNFLERLTGNAGCVGDTRFSCTRNSSHSLRLLDVENDQTLCESHELSKPFTTAIYGNMVHYYQNRGLLSQWLTWGEDEAASIIAWHRFMLVKAITSLKIMAPTLMDVAKSMLAVSYGHDLYREGLGRSFIENGLIVIMYKEPDLYHYAANQRYRQLCLNPRIAGRVAA
jgi:hypothetical protein